MKKCLKCNEFFDEMNVFCPKCKSELTQVKNETDNFLAKDYSKETLLSLDDIKRGYFSFEGRLNRLPYFLRSFVSGLVLYILSVIIILMVQIVINEDITDVISLILII